ncbi:LD-carboxypeptidase LdcB/DacB [uncultured Streptococcus sp.]|uniref:LD-carboxypeptidase LdcB/DacB n=1 Tax=uncultured Streptococcus sp. TaxID=83427 RepID=UPI001A3C3600|nr:LD-carboxypeptidase LdcB/DacB [uncultured Streptococcus sp.]VTY25054.1 Putative carboxypeptidase YodJ [uncultured Streptococcus sp.]
MNRRFLLKVTLTSLSVLTLFSKVAVAEENIHFSSCKEAWAHGYSDMREGEPGYSAKLDRDHDGVACELKNAPQGAFKPRKSTEVKSNSSSAVTSGWVQKDGVWYYYDEQGNPVTNTWKGSYYLKSDGKMAQSEWVYDASYQSWYYLKSDGSYARNEWQGSYYLKSNGKMAQSEWVYDASYQSWYYLKSDGSYARNVWQGSYYLKSDGKMAVNEWVDGGRYYVDGSGLWNSNSDLNTKVTNKGLYYSVQGKYDEILVVNKHYPLSKDYNPGENPTAKAAFLKLIAQMQKEGYAVSNNYSGFRSYGTQAQLYQSYVNREGQAAADRYSARPGYSEHQTGLAFDVIGTNGHLVEDESAAQWLLDHAADYGFVVRYLKGKESVTGYMHEEWHLRYVGKEAKEIAASGLTLEEYYGFDGGDYLN